MMVGILGGGALLRIIGSLRAITRKRFCPRNLPVKDRLSMDLPRESCLPTELWWEVFFSVPDLLSLRSVCREFRNVCDSSAFWGEKLRRECLPLLRRGKSFAGWNHIHRKLSLIRDEITSRVFVVEVDLASVPYLGVLGILEKGRPSLLTAIECLGEKKPYLAVFLRILRGGQGAFLYRFYSDVLHPRNYRCDSHVSYGPDFLIEEKDLWELLYRLLSIGMKL